MIHLIRWLIGKLRRRTTSPAEPLVAVPGRDEPAVHARGERFVTPERVAASDAKRAAPALSVDSLTKRFGERTAFFEVSFEVAHGEVFGFLGPNGAGKTRPCHPRYVDRADLGHGHRRRDPAQL